MLPQEARETLGQSVNFPKRLGNPKEFGELVAHIATNSYLNAEVIRLDGGIRMPPK
jgi:NAD(P)-dependent dehydrogenase (short-subunit alcohol dehydrogenase family)